MKILIDRYIRFNPLCQVLSFDDGSTEIDYDCTQSTDIIAAEAYNGQAAKDDQGRWVAAPGWRNHYWEESLLGFRVGLTIVGSDSSHFAYDYSVETPTGVIFHGDGKRNVLRAPLGWPTGRVIAEAIVWMCLGEDAGIEFAADTTPEQWAWIRSTDRELASMKIDDWLETYADWIETYGDRLDLLDDEAWQTALAHAGA